MLEKAGKVSVPAKLGVEKKFSGMRGVTDTSWAFVRRAVLSLRSCSSPTSSLLPMTLKGSYQGLSVKEGGTGGRHVALQRQGEARVPAHKIVLPSLSHKGAVGLAGPHCPGIWSDPSPASSSWLEV